MGKMKIDPKKWFFSDKKRVVITSSIILILVIAIVGTSMVLKNSSSSEVSAVILVNHEIQRIGETFTFDGSDSSGDIKSFKWDFGDGNESDERDPTHSYEIPGWYEVALTIEGVNGGSDNTSIRIGVQQEDTTAERTVGRWFVLDPNRRSGPAWSVLVGPNLANPVVEISIDLDRPVGTFIFTVEVTYWGSTDDRQELTIYTETASLTGGSYLFEYSVDPTDLPDEVGDGHALVNAIAQIDVGKCQGALFTLTSIFPMENLTQ